MTNENQQEMAAMDAELAASSEWKPCLKLPVIVHVREQRPGEVHVSTREGITPVRPDDLIMRGVAGEEYPIGRELFKRTYTFDLSQADCHDDAELMRDIRTIADADFGRGEWTPECESAARRLRARLRDKP